MILRKAYAGYLQPRILDAPWQGLAVNALAGAVNGGWCWTLIRNGRRLRSPSLVADGRHLLMAVISSGGVLVGVALAALTGWTVLDPALAAGVAVTSFGQAGGHARLARGPHGRGCCAEASRPCSRSSYPSMPMASWSHDLRTRHAGRITFIEFHLVLPGQMSVAQAHDIWAPQRRP